MKLSKLFMVLGAVIGLSLTSQAQIVVPDAGVGPLTFDATPPIGEWATVSIAGAGPTLANETQLDTAVAALTEAGIVTVLPTSGTVNPSTQALFRRNTTLNLIQSRPTGNNAAVLKATLQNGSANPKSGVRVSYDLGQFDAITEQIPGHRVYWSLDGTANSWQPVGTFSTAGATTFDVNVGSWGAGATLYLLWADDNADPGTDGSYTIDNVRFELFDNNDPISILVLTPQDGQQVIQSANLNVTTRASGPIARVEFLIDGALYLNDTAAPFGGAFPAVEPVFTVGNHTIQAVAYDVNETPTASFITNFTVVANTGPTITITNNFSTNAINGRIDLGPYLVGSFVTVQATVADDVAVTNVDWYVDGNLYIRRAGASTGFTYNDSRAGSHTIHGVAFDAGGLTTMSAPVNIVVTNPASNFAVLLANGEQWQTYSGGVYPPLDGINLSWYQLGYDVGFGWSNLVAEIGNGDAGAGYPESSLVDLGPTGARYSSVWFRKEFTVNNPEVYDNFRIRVLRDDGVVVFINGDPVWTNNMVSPLVDNGVGYYDFSANLAAAAAPDEGLVYQEFNLSPDNYPNLLQNSWIVAVEVHQNSLTSSDLSFDLMVWGETAALPSISITSPTNNQTFREGNSVTVNVLASTFVTNAIVEMDNVVQGSDDVLPYSVVIANLTPGMHTLVARGTDTQGNPEAVSAPVTINVLPNTPPTVVVTNLADGTNLLVGGFLINVGASAADDEAVTRVEFYDNGVLRATDTTSPYAALMVDFTVGTHLITAVAYDGANASTVSAPITVIVTNPPNVTALLTNRSDWRYFVPTADEPGWMDPLYLDGAWAVGPGKFGFGGDGETTVLPQTDVGNTITNLGFYFRKEVSISGAQLASFGGVDLWLVRDDGAVVYVNGVEVYRNKMIVPQPIPYNAEADGAAIGGNDENTFIMATNLPTSVFADGDNLIAVEIHQDGPGSSDISFDLMLWGTPPVVAAPTLSITYDGSGNATITWAPGTGTLQFKNALTDATWTDVPGGPHPAGGPVVVPASLAHRFYTLRQ